MDYAVFYIVALDAEKTVCTAVEFVRTYTCSAPGEMDSYHCEHSPMHDDCAPVFKHVRMVGRGVLVVLHGTSVSHGPGPVSGVWNYVRILAVYAVGYCLARQTLKAIPCETVSKQLLQNRRTDNRAF